VTTAAESVQIASIAGVVLFMVFQLAGPEIAHP
jgi:hypothetical protein